MSLDPARLSTAIKNGYEAADAITTDRDSGLQIFCDALAAAIVAEIKHLTITYNNGLAAGSTPVAGLFNNTLT